MVKCAQCTFRAIIRKIEIERIISKPVEKKTGWEHKSTKTSIQMKKKKKRLAIKTTKYTVKREMLDYILKNKTRNKQNCITHTRKDWKIVHIKVVKMLKRKMLDLTIHQDNAN